MKKYFSILAIFILSFSKLAAQDAIQRKVLKDFDLYRNHNFQEKLFIHTDKDFYLAGEIIWFKIYNVEGSDNKPVDFSKVAYVEILDYANEPILQAKIKLKEGMGEGSFFLPGNMLSGKYLFRAYTSWMKNFDPEFYFHKEIVVANTIMAQDKALEEKTDKSDYHVYFFPEGGHLVQDLQSKIGVKAVDKIGNGIDFKGAILNHQNDTLQIFSPLKNGMGSFTFKPESGKNYKAAITFSDGTKRLYELPEVLEKGLVMLLENQGREVKLVLAANGPETESPVYLMVHTRNKIGMLEKIRMIEGKAELIIPKEKLGEGISHLTLFDEQLRPICERLFFKRPENPLSIEISSDKEGYNLREPVNLHLSVNEDNLKNDFACLSAAVYLYDTLQATFYGKDNIISYLWLSSDLKGSIQEPEYYFTETPEAEEAADNLMLTQGWRRFKWKDVITGPGTTENTMPDSESDAENSEEGDAIQKGYSSKTSLIKHEFLPEPEEHLIKGRLIHKITGEPVVGKRAFLSAPGKSFRFYTDLSNARGEITFFAKDFYGERSVFLNTEADSIYRIELASPFCNKMIPQRDLSFQLDNRFRQPLSSASINMQVQNIYSGDNLKRISFPDMEKRPFYLKPDKAYMLDDFTRFLTMEEVFREFVPEVLVRLRRGNYTLRVIDEQHRLLFNNPPLMLIDGIPVFDNGEGVVNYDPIIVERLDIIAQKYIYGGFESDGIISLSTYNGNYEGFPLTAETLLLNYAGLQGKREFYSPDYGGDRPLTSRIPDARSLLYWNADINISGKQEISFYTSDMPGAYKVVVQGITREGKAGFASFVFEVSGEMVKQ